MSEHKIKTFSKIAATGLEALSSTACVLDEESKDPDGVLVRSTKLNKSNLNQSLKAISRAGVGAVSYTHLTLPTILLV